jgi:hypothetical protein
MDRVFHLFSYIVTVRDNSELKKNPRNPLEKVRDPPKIIAAVIKKFGAAPNFLLVHGVSPNFFGRKSSGCPNPDWTP